LYLASRNLLEFVSRFLLQRFARLFYKNVFGFFSLGY